MRFFLICLFALLFSACQSTPSVWSANIQISYPSPGRTIAVRDTTMIWSITHVDTNMYSISSAHTSGIDGARAYMLSKGCEFTETRYVLFSVDQVVTIKDSGCIRQK